MLLVRAYVGPSPIHGTGCFAAEAIKKGQVVWVLDERIDGIIPAIKLPEFPPPAQEFLLMYGYQTMQGGEKVIILCGDHAKHMNHSDEPNLIEIDDPEGADVAARDIEAGEELTCDYYSFDLDGLRKLGK